MESAPRQRNVAGAEDQAEPVTPVELGDKRRVAAEAHLTGLEPVTFGSVDTWESQESQGKTGISEAVGAETGALGQKMERLPSDLQAIIDAWPDLPEAIRAGILAMVQATADRATLASE